MENKSSSRKVLNILSNVFFALVMLLLVVFMVYGFGSISQDKVPSFFGQSYMWIQSTSMSNPVYSDPYNEESELISDGFQVGDVVVIKQVNTKDIQVGDIIAFYGGSPRDEDYTLTPIEEVSTEDIRDIDASASRYSGSRTFHQVMDIEVDEDGYIWYTTKGTHNGSVDGQKVRADYVIGIYTPSALAGILQFISSPTGIIVLVVVPSCIVLFLLLLSIIDTIDKMIKKKKEEEAFQSALVKSISSNSTSAPKQEVKTSSYGGLTESSMAGFEREMAKIEKENKNASSDKTASKPADTTQTATANKVDDSKTVETKPAGATKLNETKSTDSIKADTKSVDNNQTEAKAVEGKQVKPAEQKADKPAYAKVETKAQDEAKTTAKVDAKSETKVEAKPEVKATDTKPTDSKTAEVKPAEKTEVKEDKAESKSADKKVEASKTEDKQAEKSRADNSDAKAKTATKKTGSVKEKVETKATKSAETTKKAETKSGSSAKTASKQSTSGSKTNTKKTTK